MLPLFWKMICTLPAVPGFLAVNTRLWSGCPKLTDAVAAVFAEAEVLLDWPLGTSPRSAAAVLIEFAVTLIVPPAGLLSVSWMPLP